MKGVIPDMHMLKRQALVDVDAMGFRGMAYLMVLIFEFFKKGGFPRATLTYDDEFGFVEFYGPCLLFNLFPITEDRFVAIYNNLVWRID